MTSVSSAIAKATLPKIVVTEKDREIAMNQEVFFGQITKTTAVADATQDHPAAVHAEREATKETLTAEETTGIETIDEETTEKETTDVGTIGKDIDCICCD